MATVLLTGAALLTHSFIKLSTFNKGYDPANVLAFNLLFPDTLLDRAQGRGHRGAAHALSIESGVRAAGFARHGLLIGEVLSHRHGSCLPARRSRRSSRTRRAHTIGQRWIPDRHGRAVPSGARPLGRGSGNAPARSSSTAPPHVATLATPIRSASRWTGWSARRSRT